MPKTNRPDSVLVANDQPIVRVALKRFLSQLSPKMTVAGEAWTSKQCQEIIGELRPGLLLMEIRLQSELCFELIEWVCAKYPKTKTLVFSHQPEEVFAERALRAGADGYLSTSAETSELKSAIAKVLGGEIYLSTDVERQIVHRVARNKQNGDLAVNPCATLSNRELRILHHFGSGLSPREVAHELNLSVKTVETYRDRLKEKLGLHSTFELLRFALEVQVFGTGLPHS